MYEPVLVKKRNLDPPRRLRMHSSRLSLEQGASDDEDRGLLHARFARHRRTAKSKQGDATTSIIRAAAQKRGPQVLLLHTCAQSAFKIQKHGREIKSTAV